MDAGSGRGWEALLFLALEDDWGEVRAAAAALLHPPLHPSLALRQLLPSYGDPFFLPHTPHHPVGCSASQAVGTEALERMAEQRRGGGGGGEGLFEAQAPSTFAEFLPLLESQPASAQSDAAFVKSMVAELEGEWAS